MYVIMARPMPRPLGVGEALPDVPLNHLDAPWIGRPAACGEEPPKPPADWMKTPAHDARGG